MTAGEGLIPRGRRARPPRKAAKGAVKGAAGDAPRDVPLVPEDWIRAAIAILSENNVDALRVDELALRLGVTKGSFYWHFASREQLLAAVLQTWRNRMTTDIASYIRREVGEARPRLSKLLRTAIRPRADVPGGPLELSLRDWGRRDPAVQRVLDEVDRERVAFVAELYRGAGLGQAEAEDFALAHLAMTIGLRMLPFDGTRDDLERRWRVAEMVLVPPADEVPGGSNPVKSARGS